MLGNSSFPPGNGSSDVGNCNSNIGYWRNDQYGSFIVLQILSVCNHLQRVSATL
ncbi:hypothetical protein [uncultured Bacteroides sp.]|uniref:hypothetical protein n=1 Tax=uncultured Bacteroides sp. TaxID=162156 RepID=UPI0025CB81B5|nr:hypothetical protein [uncultured Bacteroides sp.]